MNLNLESLNFKLPEVTRVGRYFDILIYRDIFNRHYCIEGRNLSDDISKLSSCSITIAILLLSIPRKYSF